MLLNSLYILFLVQEKTYVTLDHKYNHKGHFFIIEICTLSERSINKRSVDVLFIIIGQYLA